MKLTILATSDIHGYLFPTNYIDQEKDMPFGLLKAATLIEKERKQADGPVLLVENGDFIQGSPLAQFIAERTDSPSNLVSVLNDLRYDVGIIGNHEFNYGLEYLNKGIKSADHPVLSANILKQDGTYLTDGPVHYIEEDGLKIGIIGLTTQYIPHWEHPENIQDLQFLSAVETAKEWVPIVREKADIVIVAYHGGIEADLISGEAFEKQTGENEGYRILREVSGIDALITGHQHRKMAEVVEGVPVIQPGQRGESIGKIVLDVRKAGDGVEVSGSHAELISADNARINSSLAQKYQPLADAVDDWLDEVIGHTDGDMAIKDSALARMEEHPYVEFINRVQLHYGKGDISATALFSNQVTGYQKDITVRDVIINYPYPNTLAVIKVNGAELKQALEQTAEYFTLNGQNEIIVNPKFRTIKPQPYNYDMYEGIDYIIDVGRNVGQRITKLRYNGEIVSPEDEFELVTNQYRAVGGGNYAMFEGKEFIREVNLPMSNLIVDYIKETNVVSAKVNHNFKVINSIVS